MFTASIVSSAWMFDWNIYDNWVQVWYFYEKKNENKNLQVDVVCEKHEQNTVLICLCWWLYSIRRRVDLILWWFDCAMMWQTDSFRKLLQNINFGPEKNETKHVINSKRSQPVWILTNFFLDQ